MTLMRHHGSWVIWASFIVALTLTMLPLPHWAELFRPEWVALALIYWCMALPERVGVGVGWSMGILLDVVKGTLLGQNALALTLIAYLTLRLHQRVRVFPLWQQALFVFILVALDQMLVHLNLLDLDEEGEEGEEQISEENPEESETEQTEEDSDSTDTSEMPSSEEEMAEGEEEADGADANEADAMAGSSVQIAMSSPRKGESSSGMGWLMRNSLPSTPCRQAGVKKSRWRTAA